MIRVKTYVPSSDWRAASSPIGTHLTTLIYNPVAGGLRGKGRQKLKRAATMLAEAGYIISPIPTTGPGAAGEIARGAIERGAACILVAGGDGTINEVVDGMVNSPVPLGILPAGTANVLATELGLGRDIERAAKLIPQCVARRIALGRLDCGSGPRHFLSMAGIGFDAHIVYHLSARLKTRLGKGAYWISGFAQAVRRFPEFEIELDGGTRSVCSFALVSRVRNYGGDFEIATSASLLQDHFEVILFRGRHSLPYLKYVLGMVTGRLAGMRGVSFLTGRSVRVSDPADQRVYIQVDGEYAGRLPASIVLAPEALTLLVPPGYLRRASAKIGGFLGAAG
jgi:diacylglycerol kinase (ATP)